MLVVVREDVQVWGELTGPTRLVWRGERWRVIDEPTVQDASALWKTWRFTMRSDHDPTRTMVADVEQVDDRAWSLVAAYE